MNRNVAVTAALVVGADAVRLQHVSPDPGDDPLGGPLCCLDGDVPDHHAAAFAAESRCGRGADP